MTPIRRSVLALATLGAFALPTSAHAVGTPVIVTGPGAYITNYTQPVAVAQPGDEMTYVNADAQPHDVVSVELGPPLAAHCVEDADPFTTGTQERFPMRDVDGDGDLDNTCPIFWSKLITVGQTTPVRGLENVQGGGRLYAFYCSIHGNMKATLIVV